MHGGGRHGPARHPWPVGGGAERLSGDPRDLRHQPVLFTNAGENWRQFLNFPLLATDELDSLPRHMRHPLGETPPTQLINWLFRFFPCHNRETLAFERRVRGKPPVGMNKTGYLPAAAPQARNTTRDSC